MSTGQPDWSLQDPSVVKDQLATQVRSEAGAMIDELHHAGVGKVVMLTGDVPLVAEAIGRLTGIDEVHAGLRRRTNSTPSSHSKAKATSSRWSAMASTTRPRSRPPTSL